MKLIKAICLALACVFVWQIGEDCLGATYQADVSAYCLCEKCCNGWSKVCPRRTASGHIIQAGDKFVAAPKNIPFGTMISIPGYNDGKPVPVLDRGGAIKGNRIDLFFGDSKNNVENHKKALQWGRQYVSVVICKNEKR